MRVDQFDFELPEDAIALRPASPRDSARLLHVPHKGALGDCSMLDLPDLLQPGDLLILNDTRVIPARLMGRRAARDKQNPAGAAVEVTLHQQSGPNTWHAFVKNARRLKLDDTIHFESGLVCTVVAKKEGGEVELAFPLSGDALVAAIAAAGVMPLPPYIASKRAVDDRDADDYQTMFARQDGSVAAPTASLHFTERLFSALAERGVSHCFVTLHVGAGTFLPVKADNTKDHKMHSEWGEVGADTARTIAETHKAGNRVVAVGTTALRLIETAARDCRYEVGGELAPWQGDTDIFITPGFQFRAADLLMTNFHLPRSTLFMLVSAFAGLGRMKNAYDHAVKSGYRFYSYGDGSLLERAK